MNISFVIPIYNTPIEKLVRCFGSFKVVSTYEFEVILVDDGSRVEIGEFCRKYVDANPVFQYYYQNNQGVSVARNYGIDKAKGDYIAFVDSDDEIDLEVYLNSMHHQVDLMLFDAIEYKEKGQRIRKPAAMLPGVIDSKMILDELLVSSNLNPPWAKVFKRSFLNVNQIRFNINRKTGEDFEFLLKVALCEPKCVYVNLVSYLYWYEAVSTTKRNITYPAVVITDYIELYEKKKGIIDVLNPDYNTRLKYLTRSESNLVKRLARVATDLISNNVFEDEYRKRIEDVFFNPQMESFGRWSLPNKILYWIIKYRQWGVLRVCDWGYKNCLCRKGN